MDEIIVTLIALASVAVVPGSVALTAGVRPGRPLVSACLVAAVLAGLWAVYWVTLAHPHHVKHAVLFVALAVVALVGASFSRPGLRA
ncbi:MAG: hypothetical protein NVSMB65_13580 [Chloroflexota bacterium]